MKNPTSFSRMPKKVCGPHSARWAINALGLTYNENDGLDNKSVLPPLMLKILLAHGLSPCLVQMHGDKVKMLREIDSRMRADRPIVLFVRGQLLPHWVVLCGRNKGMYYLYDPSVLTNSDTTLPVGNRAVSGKTLLSMCALRPWSYFIPSWQYVAIII